MTIRWQDKDPADTVTVEFDFSADAASVSAPTITVTVLSGTDESPAAILSGAPTIDGAKVRQRIVGGTDGVEYGLQCVASAGGDPLTIEAILPVIARPIVIPETVRYLTRAQFEQRFGVAETVDLLSNGAAYQRAESEAASLVDGYVAAKYTLPLLAVPEIVRGWVADIVRFKLWAEQAPEEVRQRYDDALEQLRDLAAGRLALPPGSNGAATTSPFEFDSFANERVFTADTLAGF